MVRAELGREKLRTGTLTVLNIDIPLMASFKAMSCGVETIIAPGEKVVSESRYECIRARLNARMILLLTI